MVLEELGLSLLLVLESRWLLSCCVHEFLRFVVTLFDRSWLLLSVKVKLAHVASLESEWTGHVLLVHETLLVWVLHGFLVLLVRNCAEGQVLVQRILVLDLFVEVPL